LVRDIFNTDAGYHEQRRSTYFHPSTWRLEARKTSTVQTHCHGHAVSRAHDAVSSLCFRSKFKHAPLVTYLCGDPSNAGFDPQNSSCEYQVNMRLAPAQNGLIETKYLFNTFISNTTMDTRIRPAHAIPLFKFYTSSILFGLCEIFSDATLLLPLIMSIGLGLCPPSVDEVRLVESCVCS
jgi:hypothetical protein